MRTRSLILLLLCCCATPFLFAQRADRELKQKERELQKLRADIQTYEKRLQESETKEKATLDRLDDLEHQSNLLRRLVKNIQDEEQDVSSDIDSAKTTIADLEAKLQFLKSHYANYVRSVYKNGRVYDLELLFSSKSINQMYIRLQYMKRFSEQRAKDLQDILASKTTVEEQSRQLEKNLQNKRQLLQEKTHEEKNLKSTYSARQTVLKKIRKNKKTYQAELTRKQNAFHQIEDLIADLIEKERIRKEHEATVKRERELAEARERERSKNISAPVLPKPPEEKISSSFEQHRGKMRWPVSSGSVQTHFGNQVHPVLKTVTQSTGIDITTPVGSNVYAVADGEVALLSFIPGFGNVIIVNHYNGYRTVYAHLSEILVEESQKVTEGTVIAKSGDTVAGSILHFEIWKEREKQNPEHWLANK